jgi:putative redox protein
MTLASSTPGVPSPVDALGYAIMGCMAMDVVHVVTKGRHRLDAMTVRLDGRRAPEPPRRFVSLALAFDLTTTAPPRVVERAIQMSRDKYCSVWHTIRPDVPLTTSFTLTAVQAEST